MQALEIGPAQTPVATKVTHNAASPARIFACVIALPLSVGMMFHATDPLLEPIIAKLETKLKHLSGLPLYLYLNSKLGLSLTTRPQHPVRHVTDAKGQPAAEPHRPPHPPRTTMANHPAGCGRSPLGIADAAAPAAGRSPDSVGPDRQDRSGSAATHPRGQTWLCQQVRIAVKIDFTPNTPEGT